ncbi:MAG TPA: MBL fold metallo-hydrolase [Blastocatellia bacterium]|nr:MBL fold metallo-hydrolase [Blastocatellia bacterium]
MCRVTRREMLMGGAALLGAAAANARGNNYQADAQAAKAGVETVAPNVYFHEGNIVFKGHCNNGWVVFEDYVLVIDANFPSGAEEVIPKIRATTDRPIRFAFDTHHHGDHAYGNQVWVDNGATPVAHTGVIDEMKRYETGYYGGKPGRWEETALQRPDVKASRLKPPSVLFPREMIFDDGKLRVELIHLGVAHTHGDAVAWMPKEKILFTGDLCVNGPYNYVGDGDTEKWIATLDAARRLGARMICPGHGPVGKETMIDDQQAFFRALRREVASMVRTRKSAQQVRDSIDKIQGELAGIAQIARYVSPRSLPSQVEKVYTELTGKQLPEARKTAQDTRLWHAHAHGLERLA